MPTKPNLDGLRAKELFQYTGDEVAELRVNLTRMLAAHTGRRDDAFYAALAKATTNLDTLQRVVELLSQGRYEDAEALLGLGKH